MERSTSYDRDLQIDLRLPTPNGDLLLEVKRTSNARDLRGVLLSLAYALAGEPPSSRAICVLTDTRLTPERVRAELVRFQEAVIGEVGRRVFVVVLKDGKVHGELPPGDESMLPLVVESAQRESAEPASRVTQQAVKSAAFSRWIDSKGRLGVSDLRRATGASMPTVVAAFRAMQHDGMVIPHGTGYALPEELPWPSVRRMAEAHAKERRVVRFTDPTGLARSPLDMARRLEALQNKGEWPDVDLGGVLGAQRYYPDLDITAAPRLDLCVYDGDTSFVRKLDAGLIETSDPSAKAVLVLHLTRDTRRAPRIPGRRLHAASAADCLADLLEIGLQAEARDFVHALQRKREAVQQREHQG